MKKVFALVLAFALVLSLGVVAFAANSPSSPTSGGSSSTPDNGWGEYTTAVAPPAKSGMEIHGADNKVVAVVPEDEMTLLGVADADKLDAEDKEAFLAAYEEAKAVEDKVVQYFYWIDIPEDFKTDGFTWFRYDFKCAGKNVEVYVNGHPMEVVHVEGVDYYAKLTEFGAVAILCDK